MKNAACIALSATLIALLGCANTKAHDNFKASLKHSVGTDIGAMMRYRAPLGETLQIIELPNGNQEYRFTMQYKTTWVRYGPCTKIYEVDSKTKKIIRADFVGTEHDCIVPL